MEQELKELESAEEFLNYFGVTFDKRVVQVNRLHILQRFHDYLAASEVMSSAPADSLRDACRGLLMRAYQDFVESDAITERVFKVFRDVRNEAFVSVETLGCRPATPRQE
jgi:nitrogenase-stabilizing/protective protein